MWAVKLLVFVLVGVVVWQLRDHTLLMDLLVILVCVPGVRRLWLWGQGRYRYPQ